MTSTIRALGRRLGLAALLAGSALAATAQTAAWPHKMVRLTVPAAPGTAPDIMARLIGDKLSALWGQTVLVETKPGAGGLIALGGVKAAERDDHALVFAPASVYALSPYMFKSKQVDIVADFVPVGLVGMSPMMAAVAAGSAAETLTDVLAQARQAGDAFVVATTAPYSVPHLTADLLSRAAGVPLRAVPYANSGQSIAAVVSGDAQLLIDGIPPLDPMIKGNRLKAVAVFSEQRLPDRPQTAAAAERWPALVINGWFGVVAPKGTRAAAIERVNRDLATVLAAPDVVARLQSLGVYPLSMSPAQFGTYWAAERQRWEKALRDVGAQPTLH